MKNSKKIFIILSISLVVVISALVAVNIIASRYDYADLIIVNADDYYVMLNDSQKYCYMRYYAYGLPDIKIRNGKNVITAILKPCFYAYSTDPQKNFLYCYQGSFAIETVGLYIKETSLDDLFEPSPENIHRIVVSDSNGIDQLSFGPENEELYQFFVREYSSELNNYFFPDKRDDSDAFEGEYTIYVEYQNGEITRFLRRINKAEFELLLNKNNQNPR